ncbi:uncharacterized protein Z518_10262 [Rhinocladiella mackenziei CBS 650.93]|uniref:Transcription factor domain-containing protein n=1 Tax=Rhinocladiella mackenziei CBS 650.93 TaxID=1442369 RepID=A0A0D2ITS0_9EURO|nr:uncharacterized protein Z518_10262 [Rhinocladiella mackenziei CBS 650.93]KIX00125.1 hypothetical protein Z518_10262 [Rhinocladiella mackenziei CBS 650.93]
MCYGLPPLISDEDCVAGIPSEVNIYPPSGSSSFLMIEDDLRDMSTTGIPDGSNTPTTLLTYQTYKLQFYIILGQITSTLYRQPHGGFDAFMSKYKSQRPAQPSLDSRGKSKGLIEAVQSLELQLSRWHNDLPKALRLSEDLTYPGCKEPLDEDDDEIIIPASDDIDKSSSKVRERREKIKNAIYGIQALLLQPAYDNALILLHRPILAVKDSISLEIFRRSVTPCWKATMRISKIGKHHAFRENQQARAISYVGIHLFTAGAVLSAFASSDPLSRWAWESKRGLSRVIKMPRRLRRKFVVSSQSLGILENLAQEVLRREMKSIIAKDTDDDDPKGVAEMAQYSLSSIREAPPAYVGSQSSDGVEQGQPPYWSNAVEQPAERSRSSAALPTSPPIDLGNSLFQDSMLEINESMLDIERCGYNPFPFSPTHHDPTGAKRNIVLAESQLPLWPDTAMGVTGSSMNDDFQQARLWWFSYDQ